MALLLCVVAVAGFVLFCAVRHFAMSRTLTEGTTMPNEPKAGSEGGSAAS